MELEELAHVLRQMAMENVRLEMSNSVVPAEHCAGIRWSLHIFQSLWVQLYCSRSENFPEILVTVDMFPPAYDTFPPPHTKVASDPNVGSVGGWIWGVFKVLSNTNHSMAPLLSEQWFVEAELGHCIPLSQLEGSSHPGRTPCCVSCAHQPHCETRNERWKSASG